VRDPKVFLIVESIILRPGRVAPAPAAGPTSDSGADEAHGEPDSTKGGGGGTCRCPPGNLAWRFARSGRLLPAEGGARRQPRRGVLVASCFFLAGGNPGGTPLAFPIALRLTEWGQIRVGSKPVESWTRVSSLGGGRPAWPSCGCAPGIGHGQRPGPLRRQGCGPLQLAKGLAGSSSSGPFRLFPQPWPPGQRSGDPRGCLIGQRPDDQLTRQGAARVLVSRPPGPARNRSPLLAGAVFWWQTRLPNSAAGAGPNDAFSGWIPPPRCSGLPGPEPADGLWSVGGGRSGAVR